MAFGPTALQSLPTTHCERSRDLRELSTFFGGRLIEVTRKRGADQSPALLCTIPRWEMGSDRPLTAHSRRPGVGLAGVSAEGEHLEVERLVKPR
jgi:hypothetical protein